MPADIQTGRFVLEPCGGFRHTDGGDGVRLQPPLTVQGADDSYSEVEDSVLRLLVMSMGGAIETASRHGRNGLISSHPARHYAQAVTLPPGTMAISFAGYFIIGFLAANSGQATGRLALETDMRCLEWPGE